MKPTIGSTGRALSWSLRTAHLLGLGHNPLRRGSDRFESWMLVTALVCGLAVVPVAAAIGSSVSGSASQAAAHQRAITRPVEARTVHDAPSAIGVLPGVETRVAVEWQDRRGVERRSTVPVPPETRAGSAVVVWVDASGSVVPAPLSDAGVAGRATLAAVKVLLGSWLVLSGLVLGIRWLLDRRRWRRWDAEWQQVGPVWTRRF